MKRLLLILAWWLLLCLPGYAQSVYKMQYWFDGQYSTCVTDSNTTGLWQAQLDVSHLSEGLHSVYIHFRDTSGQWSSPKMYYFYMASSDNLTYTCWFDEDFAHRQDGNFGSGNVLFAVDSLEDGTHIVNVLLGEGSNTMLNSWMFVKVPIAEQLEDSSYLMLVYMVDEEAWPAVPVDANTGLAHLDIDVGILPSGIHVLDYFVLSSDGRMSTPTRAFFYSGNDGIRKYEWWLNDGDTAMRVVNVIPQSPFQLMTMLMVDTLPIRPSCLHLVTTETPPVIYAKNDVHFRFWDNRGDFVKIDKQYVDYNVVDTVYADTLERDTTKVIPAPTNNNIHWFKLAAGVGDSLSFHTDHRCTMQLYAPSGEKVFHVSGDSVLSWDGCHAWEDGVYYLAVHDAEGTGMMSVSYQWIYRYAVLAWDVHRVGNGGVSTITFEGNGFDSISNIILYNNSADTIIPLAFYGCRSECSVTIDFTNVQQGLFGSSFRFGDYYIDISDMLMVESPVDITIGLSVEYANSFLRGTSAVYNVSITNYGNSTIYDVPIEIMVRNDTTINNIRRIRIVDEKNDEWGYCGAGILSDTLDANVKAIIKDILDNRTGLNMFISVQDSLTHYENLNTMSLLTIPPYGQYKFRIEILSTDIVSCYVSIPYEWPFLIPVLTDDDTSYQNSQILMNSYDLKGLTGNLSKSQSSMCCEKEKYECLIHTTADWASLFPGVGCAASTIDFFSFYAIELWCASEGNWHDKWYEFCYQMSHKNTSLRKATFEKGWNAILQCLTMSLDRYYKELQTLIKRRNYHLDLRRNWNPGDDRYNFHNLAIHALDVEIGSIKNEIVELLNTINDLKKIYDALVNSFRDVSECIQVWQNGTGCNDKQTDGGSQPPVNSLDPNDITGYIAESGSHAISAEQQQMPYMIEFENDTAFATAHAHTVVVKDTLDGNVFDLSSFSATAFAIGDNVTTINGSQSFTRTVDMRPEIDVLAQVQLDYQIDTTFAVATWIFSSLDPMTLQPTIADTLGFLGIGGTGDVKLTINRKSHLPDSTIINNRAWITFDNEEPIATSTWSNIVDNMPPTSSIDTMLFAAGTAKVVMHATDNLSGTWRYHVYGQVADSIWLPLAMNIPIDSVAMLNVDSLQYAAFLTTAIDSAGNVEPLKICPNYLHFALTDTACGSYEWNGTEYTASGDYTYSHTDANSCTQVDTLHLTLFNSFTMPVAAYTWYAISSPMHSHGENEEIRWVENLTDSVYDLYRYNESKGRWERPLPSEDDAAGVAVLERGRGYIYRTTSATPLSFCGLPNVGNFTYEGINDVDNFGDITTGCSDTDLRGFHLVGNPYPHKIYKGIGLVGTNLAEGYYLLQPNGTWLARLDTAAIAAGQAVLLKATEATALNFYDNADTPTFGDNPTISFTVTDSLHSDVTYAMIEENGNVKPTRSLMKIGHFGEGQPVLYIAQEGYRYAIAMLDEEVTEFPLVFRGIAGEYTLSVKTNGLGTKNYMHLIDLQDGKDVDLLAHPEYSFKANGISQFLVRLSPSSTSNGNDYFAFIDGDRIIIDATQVSLPTVLQVYDIIGRPLFDEPLSTFKSEISTSRFPSTGAYILRLGEKRQKIVIKSKH